MKPVVFGLAGLELTADERAFFADAEPCGYILFGRNIADRDQLRALTYSLRALHGNDRLPILIDQEGGRVQRMKPPEWQAYPAGGAFDRLFERAPASAIEAARANAALLAADLAEVGINVNCAPALDVLQPGATEAIGDRSLGSEPLRVAALGRAILDGFATAGVIGVVKHMPGHGRATVDSHMELPRVDANGAVLATDFRPFKALRDAAMGMTAHIVYTEWDAERPATHSPVVIEQVIRGEIGFEGLLFSDDLDMKALQGSAAERAVKAVEAGCDVALNCWARMDEMVEIANALPEMSARSIARLDRAMGSLSGRTHQYDLAELREKRDALLRIVAT